MTDSPETTAAGLSPWPKVSEDFSGLALDALKRISPNKHARSYFHYTSGEGLKGIIQGNCLHFSDSKFMNDGSERRWGLEVFKEVVDSLLPPLADEVKTFLEETYAAESRLSEDFRNVIFCMSAEGNLLNQWRDYGKDVVPYCIEFDADYFLEDQGAAFSPGVIKVIYDYTKQKALLQELISSVFQIMGPYWGKLDARSRERCATRASFQAGHLLETYKHPAFSAEKEYRLNISHYSLMQSDTKPMFRTTALGLVPYYKWQPATKLPIKSVRVGPSPHSDASVDALKFFLDQNGVEAEATVSAIPIRR